MSPYTVWISKVSDTDIVMAPLGSGGVVTVDMGGYVRLWETGLDNLQRSLLEWRNMIGSEDGRPVQVRHFGITLWSHFISKSKESIIIVFSAFFTDVNVC